jgi:nitronate monooxygenase
VVAERIRALVRRPIVVAPMGGGPSNPALVVAAASAGALAFLAAGYKSAETMREEIQVVRNSTSEAFGVNIFVPGAPASQPEAIGKYVASLSLDAAALDTELGDAVWDNDHWSAKVSALLADPPPIVSFTFGCPPREIVEALRAAGSVVAVTVTCPAEARLAADAGADCLCVQGAEAGAHRGTFTNDGGAQAGPDLGTLISEVARVTDLPLIAAGGIMSAPAVAAVLHAGAIAAQCGTAFLRCPESGANRAHKAALVDGRFTSTALTRAFSGRPARGLVNQFMLDHPDAPAAYPEINNATRPLRAAAAKAGDVERMSLWAGSGFKETVARPAGEIVDLLWPEHGRR